MGSLEWTAAAILGFASLSIVFVRRWRRRRHRAVRICFDMILPSEWAAELTQRVLEGEGTESMLRGQKGQWICRVIRELRLDSDRCETLRAHFNQIARARGGECPDYRVLPEG